MLKVVSRIYQGSSWPAYQNSVQLMFNQTRDDLIYPLIYCDIPDPAGPRFSRSLQRFFPNSDRLSGNLEDYRFEDINEIEIAVGDVLFECVYSMRKIEQTMAVISLTRMIFITFIMSISMLFFQNTSTNLVLNPIERMLEKVQLIARNPLAAAKEEQIAMAGIMTMMHNKENKEQKTENKPQDEKSDNVETVMLEAAITKIGHLLALGFGEAGSAIIGNNMTGEGELNPMIEGQRTYAVFGFTDIRNFAVHTEVLQTRIMAFVNQIAEIAHSQVDLYGGSANKNLGEAFLMTWKFDKPEEFNTR
jgi:hypothetical protein